MELGRVGWKGEGTYRVLSYYFTVRWNWRRAGSCLDQTLAAFAIAPDPSEVADPPTPGIPPRYSLVSQASGNGRRYLLLYGEHEMAASRDERDVLNHFLWHVNAEAMRHTRDFFVVHAGAVATTRGEGLLLPGPSGSGKTSLVAGLVRAGFDYLSDEAALVDPVTRQLYPYPRALALKPGIFGEFAALRAKVDGSMLLSSQWYVPPDTLRPGAARGPCSIGFVVVPRYEREAPTRLTAISPAAAVTELARNAVNLGVYRERALQLLAEVVRGARSYRLVSGDLGEAVAAITDLTGGDAGGAASPGHARDRHPA